MLAIGTDQNIAKLDFYNIVTFPQQFLTLITHGYRKLTKVERWP